MYISFVTNGSNVGQGWSASYTTEEKYLNISPSSATVSSEGVPFIDAEYIFTVESNTHLIGMSFSEDWIRGSFRPTGLYPGNYAFLLKCERDENTLPISRTATITFSVEGIADQTVTVTQQAGSIQGNII